MNLYRGIVSYNSDLAAAGVVLSEAAYSNPEKVMNQLGFTVAVYSQQNTIDQPAYIVGYRATYDFGNPHVEIVMAIRGSCSLDDWLTNIKGVTDAFDGPSVYCYNALKSAKTKIANDLAGKGITMSKANTKYFITGHSQGGACAGKLTLKAINDGLVNPVNTYTYTFAAPNYTAFGGKLDSVVAAPGIYNVVNTHHDIVPEVPSWMFSYGVVPVPLSRAGTDVFIYPNDASPSFMSSLYSLYDSYPWDRYGELKSHMTPTYLACVLGCEPMSKVAKTFSRLLSVHCPVDVAVYDSDGELCGYTEDGIAHNVEHSAVCILVNGDEKFVSIPDDDEYTIKYTGNDAGTMKIEDQLYNIETGEVVSEETFENVALEKGKVFTSSADGAAASVDTDLFVLDADSKPIAEVQNNGAEVSLPPTALSDAVVTLSQKSYTYDGKAKEPGVTVKLGDKELTAGTDYTVAYSNNVQVGTATVTVTGKGSYMGTAEATFSIAAADNASASDGADEPSAPTEPSPRPSTSDTPSVPGNSAQPSTQDTSETPDGQNAPSTSGEPAKQEPSGSAAVPGASEDPAAPAEAPRAMHRLYNQWSGEHFYTADDAEFAGLVALGWTDEGTGWTAPETSSTPVFRLYNPYAGEHHYTMDAAERDAMVAAGWVYEDVGWYSDDAKAVPLYREYNPNEPANNHNYTTNKDEHNSLVSIGWVDEGYAWYGVQPAA